jgi:asparagine synthase (glutamine-hydrolysing)
MCGIAGAYQGQSLEGVKQMVDRLKHRGPDGDGVMPVEVATLGHTRLAIVDVEGGAQPLKHKQISISFNGEIYNFEDLRRRYLADQEFKTHTDTETVLHLYRRFGPRSVELLDGMFAFAIISDGELFLARDPLGIKPLYIGEKNGKLYFASEIKALSQVTDDIREFPAGHWFHSRQGLKQYYSLEGPLANSVEALDNEDQALDVIRQSLHESVRKRLMSDVPLGVSLSGGLDSSIISLLASYDMNDLHSFAVGVEGSSDLQAARLVADFLGTHHHEYIYSEQDMLKALPEVVFYLESFDPALVRSAIPNYFLAKMASEHVKVLLTGEGADELFAGYSYLKRYESPDDLQRELVYITNALHNTNLQRGDRMSMAHGLEARVPFLDVSTVSTALSLPPLWKLQRSGRVAKSLLRRSFDGRLPDEIVHRPKMKFSKGAGSSDLLRLQAEAKISDQRFLKEKARFQREWDYPLQNKEALFYYDMLRQSYKDNWIMPNMGRSRSL